jgi:hypothetical protein
MRYFAIILLLTACTASYHVRRAQKHITKAQAKGATFGTDTSYRYIYRTDTLYNDITKEIEVIRKVVDSVPVYHNVIKYVPKTRYQERIEYKLKRDTLRVIKYITKKENKTKVKTHPVTLITKVVLAIWLVVVAWMIYKMATWRES